MAILDLIGLQKNKEYLQPQWLRWDTFLLALVLLQSLFDLLLKFQDEHEGMFPRLWWEWNAFECNL